MTETSKLYKTETTKLYKCIKLLKHIRNLNHLAIQVKRGYHQPIQKFETNNFYK